jgi:metal-responsive CopG/Arc/MetJ family transcriptional regulator
MRKVAITLPDDQAKAIEDIRRKKRIPRSRVIQQAIAYYLAEQEVRGAVREYEEGYRHYPEDGADAEAFGTATAAVLSREDWG